MLLNGELAKNPTFNGNVNQNVNFFNVDMTYTWEFAPGSFINIVWKNSIVDFKDQIEKNYFKNFNNTMEADQNNNISFKIIYFLDYLQLKNHKKKTSYKIKKIFDIQKPFFMKLYRHTPVSIPISSGGGSRATYRDIALSPLPGTTNKFLGKFLFCQSSWVFFRQRKNGFIITAAGFMNKCKYNSGIICNGSFGRAF